MDYYAAWPKSSVPKWAGIAMGGIFTLIVVACAGMIVHLLRPSKHAPPSVVAAATVAQPKPAVTPSAAVAPAPVAPAPVAQPAPVAAAAPAVAQAAKKHPAHKRAILAKHEGKSSRSSKSDIDRLLGL